MEYQKLEYYLSPPRIDRFLLATGGSKSKAQRLYKANLRVAQSFYPVLNLFEIFLRNMVNNHISAHFANPHWIIAEKSGFMSHSSIRPTRFYLRKSVEKAENAVRRKRGLVTSGKVIAEQSFGFWTSLFETHHYRLIGGSAIHAFPNKPASENRSSICLKLNEIREFRNRIYHNEPICFRGSSIDFSEANRIKTIIYDLLNWIDAGLTDYVEDFDSIEAKIRIAERI